MTFAKLARNISSLGAERKALPITRKVIFDFGANKGQNIEYFLGKADLVIAVEPVPEFCEVIETKFSHFLGSSLLVVQAFVTDDEKSGRSIPFFVSEKHPGISTFLDREGVVGFSKITVETVSAAVLINSVLEEGDILEYIKIDCEGADELILKSMIANDFLPNHLSIEIHDEKIFREVTELEQYVAFRIETAGKVNSFRRFVWFLVSRGERRKNYTLKFSPISSGPFGPDLNGRWFNKSAITEYFEATGGGARDLHASRTRKGSKDELSLGLRLKLPVHKFALNFKLLVVARLKTLLPEKYYAALRDLSYAVNSRKFRDERARKKFLTFQ